MPLEPLESVISACQKAVAPAPYYVPEPRTKRGYVPPKPLHSLRRTAAFTATAPPDPKPQPVIPRTVPAPFELCEGGFSVLMPDGRVLAFDTAIYYLTREGGAK